MRSMVKPQRCRRAARISWQPSSLGVTDRRAISSRVRSRVLDCEAGESSFNVFYGRGTRKGVRELYRQEPQDIARSDGLTIGFLPRPWWERAREGKGSELSEAQSNTNCVLSPTLSREGRG